MRHIPTFVSYFTGFISGIFFSVSAIYFPANKTLGLWAFYGGIMFGILAGFFYIQNYIWKTEIEVATEIKNSHTRQNKDDVTNEPSHTSPPRHITRGIVVEDSLNVEIKDNVVIGADEGYSLKRNKGLKASGNIYIPPKPGDEKE